MCTFPMLLLSRFFAQRRCTKRPTTTGNRSKIIAVEAINLVDQTGCFPRRSSETVIISNDQTGCKRCVPRGRFMPRPEDDSNPNPRPHPSAT